MDSIITGITAIIIVCLLLGSLFIFLPFSFEKLGLEVSDDFLEIFDSGSS